MSMPDSPPHIPRVYGTALTFRSPKFLTRFQNLVVNKTIIYGKPVDLVLFQNIGVITMFKNVGLSAMLSPPKSAYPVLIKQFFRKMTVKSDMIDTFV